MTVPVLPLLIGFGLIAALLIADKNEHGDRGTVIWWIVLVMFGLVAWGSLSYIFGFESWFYR